MKKLTTILLLTYNRNPFLCRAGFILSFNLIFQDFIEKSRVAIPFYVGQVSSWIESGYQPMPLPLNRNPFLCRAGFIKKNENQRCYLWQILHRNPFLCRAGFIPKDLSELERMKKFIAIPFYVGQVSSWRSWQQFYCWLTIAIPFYVGQVSSWSDIWI